ncbi:hypothetical protein CTI12_AA390180 [Artemisia annua]|uniref:Uncharacterized protein n=1 Tax=Artemisia annua TaxID=35608 RepID=A0A2U1MEI1_ARTAN|nr:hypothetical protein CTI12_AA390180 [Artemisia annua]
MEKTEIVKVLQQLGVGFGNLIATMENILLGYQPKLSDLSMISIVCLHLPGIVFDIRMLHAVQSRQVDDVSRLSDFQVASEWPTLTAFPLTGLPNNQRSMVLDFGEGAAHLDGPHVLDFKAGVVQKDVHHSTSANLMSRDFVPSYDEHLVQQLDVQPARTTCQTRVLTGGVVGGPRPSSHTRSHVQPSATAAITGMRSQVLGKRQYNHVSRGMCNCCRMSVHSSCVLALSKALMITLAFRYCRYIKYADQVPIHGCRPITNGNGKTYVPSGWRCRNSHNKGHGGSPKMRIDSPSAGVAHLPVTTETFPSCLADLYIYDTDNEVTNRLNHFGPNAARVLRADVVEGLIQFLNHNNALVQLFRTARDKLNT